MIKGILFSVLILFMVSCGPSTKIVNSWRDPAVSIDTSRLNKFVVAALLKNQSVRRQVEDQMAALMPGKAVQSYTEFGNAQVMEDNNQGNDELMRKGYDGIVLMRLDTVQDESRYVPGVYPGYYRSWRGYWGMSALGFYDPGYYTTDRDYDVEVNVYSLKSNKLIWSGYTSTINPKGRVELFSQVSRSVYKKMKTEGFIK